MPLSATTKILLPTITLAIISTAIAATLAPIQPPAPPTPSTPPTPASTPLPPHPHWPGPAPGDKPGLGPEHDSTKQKPGGGPEDGIIRLADVSVPTITVYRPSKASNTGAAVIVCPGGGYHILAMNLEGTESCEWLNSLGVTAVLLKYRVPVRPDRPRFEAPLQDAQRAIGIVRQRAAEWNLDPHRIGILGFSAGGHLSAVASNSPARTYDAIDAADKQPCRPDFTLLIYPAYLTREDDRTRLADELKVTKETPPAFIAMTADDPIHMENAMAYTLALKNAGVSAELHMYPTGGHGYGLRPSDHAVSSWPARAAEWMKTQGWLKRKGE